MPGDQNEDTATAGARRLTLGFVARSGLVLVGVWALASVAWLGRDIVLIAFLAVLLAIFLAIFVGWLEMLGLGRTLSTVLVVLGLGAVLFGIGYVAWPTLTEQADVVRQTVPRVLDDFMGWVESTYRRLMGAELTGQDGLRQQLRLRLGGEAARIVAGALPLLNTALGAVSGILVILVAGAYLAANPRPYVDGLVSLVPPRSRDRVRGALQRAGHILRWWMLGTSVNMVIIATASTLGLLFLAVPAPLVLGLIAGLFVFIPFIGPILGAIPAVALGFTVSPLTALWVVALYAGIQLLESNLLTPMVMREAVELPPALTVLVQMLMAVLFGFIGLLVAVPLLAATRVLVQDLYVERLEERMA